jgi:hypothetical protein
VRIDPMGKAAGRGAYVHDLPGCWETALRGGLARALRTELTDTEREELTAFAKNLAERPRS